MTKDNCWLYYSNSSHGSSLDKVDCPIDMTITNHASHLCCIYICRINLPLTCVCPGATSSPALGTPCQFPTAYRGKRAIV